LYASPDEAKKGLTMFRKMIAIVLIASLTASSTEAALLTNIQGRVTVNHGYGYESAGVGGQVGPGDRVHAGDGSADIVYENGSTVKVGSGQTVIVRSTAPASTDGSQTPDAGIYAAGGMLATGGVAAAIVFSQGNSSNGVAAGIAGGGVSTPASP
jgi:hypothetical protein